MKPKLYKIDDIKKINLTTGNLFLKMGLFSIPFGLTTFISMLNSTITLIFVNMFGGGAVSSSSVSSSTTLILLMTVLFTYIGGGVSILISNNIGAKKDEFAKKIMHTSLILAVIFGFLVLIVGYFMTPTLLKWIGTNEAYVENATLYMHIYFLAFPMEIVYLYITRFFQAMGDSRTPFLVLLGSLLINTLFSFVFIYFVKLDVLGLSLAYVISTFVACLTMVILLIKNKKFDLNLRFKELRIDKEAFINIVKVGLPIGAQRLLFAVPGFFVQASLYKIANGDVTMLNGAFAAGTISGYLFCFVEGITESVLTMTALNYGAKNKDNIRKVIRYGIYWSLIINAICCLVALFAYKPLLMLLVEEESVTYGKQRMWIITFTYLLCSFTDIFANALKGMKHTTSMLITSFITSCLFRIIYVTFIVPNISALQNLLGLYAVYGLGWAICLILNIVCFIVIARKDFMKLDEEKLKEEESSQKEEAVKAE